MSRRKNVETAANVEMKRTMESIESVVTNTIVTTDKRALDIDYNPRTGVVRESWYEDDVLQSIEYGGYEAPKGWDCVGN